MTHRSRQNTFDFNADIAQPDSSIKNPKSNRTKFIKDLNHKSNAIIRSERNNKLNENSKQKDFILKKQRSRKNSQVQMSSLLQKAIPGAKIIKGDWKDHKLNGQVQIQYDNGNRFIGKYQNGVRVEGKMTYPELNCEYEGSFFAQKFSGTGRLSYKGGRTIEGEWDNMEFIGNATITYPNKDVYYGPVDQKLFKHGQGYLFLHNGQKYIGSFMHGSITGVGSYFKDDKLIIKGKWLKGKLVKQITNGQQTEGLQGMLAPRVDLRSQQSSKQNISYRYKNKEGNSNRSKRQKSVKSFSSSDESIIHINQKQR